MTKSNPKYSVKFEATSPGEDNSATIAEEPDGVKAVVVRLDASNLAQANELLERWKATKKAHAKAERELPTFKAHNEAERELTTFCARFISQSTAVADFIAKVRARARKNSSL